MLIDWFTVGAQVLNFVVLVWLLRRFLYKPVLSAIDAREQRMSRNSADADRQKNEVQTARDKLQAERSAFDAQRDALLAKAVLDAKAEGERLLGNARQTAEQLAAKQNAALTGESVAMTDALARLAAAESLNIARAALKALAGVDLEERISEVFVRRVRDMDPETKKSFGISIKRAGSKPVVASSLELSDREKAAIQTAVNETLSADVPLQFETSGGVIAGIELNFGGRRLAWSISDYLQTLDGKVAALLAAGSTVAA